MTKGSPLIVDASRHDSGPRPSPDLPLPTRQSSTWHSIGFGHHQHSAAFETPEHCFSQHFLTIHLNQKAVEKQRRLGGQVQRDRFRHGDICITPAKAPVSVQLHDASEIVCLYLEPALLSQMAADVVQGDRLEVVPQFKLNDPLIYQLAMALKANIATKGVWDRLYAESMATALSAHLLQNYSVQQAKPQPSSGLSPKQLRQVTDYIAAHSAQNISLTTLAQTAQMSPYHFSRLFKRATGFTPHQYLLRQRTARAKRLLKTSSLSVAAIAAQVGFADQSHLARHFKRHMGVSPSQFR